MALIVTGSLAFDRISVFKDRFAEHILPDKIHQLSVSFVVDEMSVHHGGTAGNIGYNLSLLGEQVELVATVGTDFDPYRQKLNELKVGNEYVKVIPDTLTATATIMTDLDDNQITAFYTGAIGHAQEVQLAAVKEDIDLVVIAPNNPQAMVDHAKFCNENLVDYIADPGQALGTFSKQELQDLIKGARILVVNDYEWELVKEKTGFSKDNILDHVGALIITLGENGSQILASNGQIEIPAQQAAQVVDPTGAGDAYRAGLMYGLNNGFNLEKSATIGSWIAAKAVAEKGTQNHTINKDLFDQFVKSL